MNKFNKGLVPLSSWCDSERHNSYQPILRYLYTEVTKSRGEISLHKHFKLCV